MRKFQTLKLSQFHKEKTCWTQNWWSSGIMSNFWEEFFYVLGGKKNSKFFFKNILATALKSYIKWLLQFFFFFLKKFQKVEKTGIISTKSRYDVLHLLYSAHQHTYFILNYLTKVCKILAQTLDNWIQVTASPSFIFL